MRTVIAIDFHGDERGRRTDRQIRHATVGVIEPLQDGLAYGGSFENRALYAEAKVAQRGLRGSLSTGLPTGSVGQSQNQVGVVEQNHTHAVLVGAL